MELAVKTGSPEQQRTGCVVVAVHQPRRLGAAARALDEASGGKIGAAVRSGDLDGEIGQQLLLHDVAGLAAERVLLVGCGKERELNLARFQNANAEAARALDKTGATDAVSYLAELAPKGLDVVARTRWAAVASDAALYRFERMKGKAAKQRHPLKKLTFGFTSRGDLRQADTGLQQAKAINAGLALTRDLGNLPPNVCTPTYLADSARRLKKEHRKLKLEVLEESDMESLGMGALLAVARGSRQPAKLIVIQYQGAKAADRPVALVGKGVTFDSGGISLKPGAAMDEMKFDMCGAASVLGVVKACAELRLPLNLVALVPATENMPDGQATRPGDVVTSMSGQTVEILNTDAEGRLILCDALTYCDRFKPQAVIDIATLTGACIVALGEHAAGLLGNHQGLIGELLKAGQDSSDRCWELPLWEDYQEQLKSNFADMANIGGKSAGTITAACFLARYTEKYRWAHLDIAGVAWKSGREKGATGRPVSLLMQYLLAKAGIA